MSMLNCFFSNQFTGREDLFKGLAVWKKEKYRKMQGTYPVIFLSFAAIKGSNYEDARDGIIMAINEAYSEHRYLLESNELTDGERKCFEELDYYAKNPGIKKQVANDTICNAVKNLANCLSRYYKKKVIILLDEYDTPMQEAYLYRYHAYFQIQNHHTRTLQAFSDCSSHALLTPEILLLPKIRNRFHTPLMSLLQR